MEKIKKIFAIFTILLVFVGCNEDILDLKNPNQYDTGTFFKTEAELLQGTNAVYGGLYFGGLWTREYYFIFDLLGNDASVATALQGELAEFAKYTFNAAHGQINVYWRSLYRIVLRANLVIDQGNEFLQKNPENANVKRFIAEAKYLRAWAYFELVNQFGRVPIKQTLTDLQVIETPRASKEDVWKLIEADLNEAISILPETYEAKDFGRATKGAAIAMLGKSYLYQKRYEEANTQFVKLDGKYQLLSAANYGDNWTDVDAKENNSESVFEVQIKKIPGSNTWFMFGGQEDWGAGAAHSGRPMEYGWNDWQNVYISPAAVSAFKYKDESGSDYIDPRASHVFYGDGVLGDDAYCEGCALKPKSDQIYKGGAIYPYWSFETEKSKKDPKNDSVFNDFPVYKLDVNGKPIIKTQDGVQLIGSGYRWKKYQNYEKIRKEGLPESSNNGKVIRYADVLLMRAEALIQTNKITEGIALINQVRERIGAFKYVNSYSQAEAMNLLKRERQLELCGEQQRYRDLVRWGDAASVLNAELNAQYSPGKNNNYFQDKHVLFPIPQSEKDTNPAVKNDIENEWN